ncbi:hypothetical protein ACFC09_42820, partial [Streptomyces sp. NPDC056161]
GEPRPGAGPLRPRVAAGVRLTDGSGATRHGGPGAVGGRVPGGRAARGGQPRAGLGATTQVDLPDSSAPSTAVTQNS